MEKSMELLWAKLEDKLNQQTLSITTAVTSNVMEALNEKMESIIKENKYLKNQIETLEQKVEKMETEKRKNNLVFFGLEEKGKRESELVEYIKEIVTKTGIHLDSQEIANVYRIGAQSQKNHPVVVTLTTLWKKHLLLKNKAKFASGIYIKEDYSKNVLAIRKQLQPQVEEERKKGNIAYIKHDKLVVKKPNDPGREKRKREHTASPNSPTHRRPNPNIENMPSTSTPAFTSTPGAKEIIKPSMLNYVTRGRSSSLSDVPKNQ